MNKGRPNPFWHMITWGIGSGILLAMSYLVIWIDLLGSFGGENPLSLLINPGAWWLAFIFGGVPGAVMGFFCALNVWGLLRNAPLPFTKTDMNQKRPAVYSSLFGLTFLISLVMLFVFFAGIDLWLDFLDYVFLSLPPFIASVAAMYAGHRYMFRLKLWSGGIESRKSKAKNEALGRLSDQQDIGADYSDYDAYQSEKQDRIR